jgi:hypothetical protein
VRRRRQLRAQGKRCALLAAIRRGSRERFKKMKLVSFYGQRRERRLVRGAFPVVITCSTFS